MKLALCASARAIDAQAATWGLHERGLVEAAGREAASVFASRCPELLSDRRNRVVAILGSGNNAADTLILLKALLFRGVIRNVQLGLVRVSRKIPQPDTPYADALLTLEASGVVCLDWGEAEAKKLLASATVLIDGLSGTGLSGPLAGANAECVAYLNGLRGSDARPFVVAMDIPSGLSDRWQTGDPLLEVDLTLAIEPVKLALYGGARPLCGEIIPITGIFPPGLLDATDGPLFVSDFASVSPLMPTVRPDAYKHERGVLEIHAGEAGTSGAPILCARGAQASGAGLIKLCVPNEILNLVAPGAGGIMVEAEADQDQTVTPSAILAGPGWIPEGSHEVLFGKLCEKEAAGLPLVLDAGAIDLARGHRFSGYAILTPHPGEFSRFTGLSREAIAADANAILREAAQKANATIILKGHVIRVASPNGSMTLFDGMNPALAAGGTGDILAGIVAGIAARYHRSLHAGLYDPGIPAITAVALFLDAACRVSNATGFFDPLALTAEVARLSGRAWLPGGPDV